MHLIATLSRHGRGMLNAVEKFERTVPREYRSTEIAEVVGFAREALASADKALSAASTD